MTMSTEANETVELATTQTTPEQTQPAPEVVTPETEQKPAEEAKPESEEDQRDKTLRRMERRISQKHAQAAAAEARAQMLEQRLAQYESRESGQPEQQPTADPYELAKEIAAVERITEKANNIANDALKRYGDDFKTSLATVAEEAGQLFDQRGKPTAIGEAILDAEDPAALLHHLGQNPDLAAELNGLSPAALGRRIGRIEAQMSAKPAPKPVSKAPEPARPISATRASVNPADMSQAEYEAYRRAQGARYVR